MIQSRTSRRNTAKREREQLKLDAGTLGMHFPQVEGIIVTMKYHQQGVAQFLPRTVHFFPTSCALLRIECLNKECIDGGFDLTPIISDMIRKGLRSSKGELRCDGDALADDHSMIHYHIAITYA